jgi:uncharacterized GH25 family protein
MRSSNCFSGSRHARAIIFLISFCAAAPASTHDFWLQPNEYWVSPAAQTPMTVQVGHGPFRQRSPIPLTRITRFQAFGPGGEVTDMRGHLQLGEKAMDGELQFSGVGTYVLVLETDNRAQSHLPAIRFNDYLKVEGLTPALEQRARTQRMQEDGSENYSRCAKSIVQVGPAGSSQLQVLKPIGLPLEIVPEQSPYAEPRPSSLPVRVIYEGQPLAGALVKLTNLDQDDAPFETHVTDQAGRATFGMPGSGSWLLNVIWTKVLPKSRETDFETTFSSLSFGFSSSGTQRP